MQFDLFRHSPSTVRYTLTGLVLAFGAPLGWLFWRTADAGITPARLGIELALHLPLYGYLLTATAIAFGVFGARLGWSADKLRHSNAALAEAALVDALTKLKNRRYFSERLHAELARAHRDGTPVALIIIDLDHFKTVNDATGHSVGDATLEAVSRAIQENCRVGDSACRVGGDELAVICPSTDAVAAAKLAERLRKAVEHLQIVGDHGRTKVTVSLGVAVTTSTIDSDSSLFAAADKAMYEAKLAGRNRVVVNGTVGPGDGEPNWTLAHETFATR